MRTPMVVSFLVAVLCVACDPQGGCVQTYGTPNASFACRGGTYAVTCVGVDPTRDTAPPYDCTCTAPDGATSTFAIDREIWTYQGSTDFSEGYATVNTNCHWNLSH